jgi:hypothetical protein
MPDYTGIRAETKINSLPFQKLTRCRFTLFANILPENDKAFLPGKKKQEIFGLFRFFFPPY